MKVLSHPGHLGVNLNAYVRLSDEGRIVVKSPVGPELDETEFQRVVLFLRTGLWATLVTPGREANFFSSVARCH